MTLPNNGNITSPYGVIRPKSASGRHKGIDFGYGNGTDIICPCDGVVSVVAYDKVGFGNYISVIPDSQSDTRIIFAHLHSVKVKKNEKLKEGQLIGIMGDTGNSYGTHLHFEVRENKVSVDAAKWLGIANEKGVVKMLEKDKEIETPKVSVNVGKTKVTSSLIDDVTCVQLRPFIDAINLLSNTKFEVTWNQKDGAGVILKKG